MTNRRRIILIIVSVLGGTLLSAWLISSKRGKIGNDEIFLLGTNLVISLILIFGIGYIIMRSRKKQ